VAPFCCNYSQLHPSGGLSTRHIRPFRAASSFRTCPGPGGNNRIDLGHAAPKPVWAPTTTAGAQNNGLGLAACPGDERRDDVGRMPVERGPCAVVPHCRAGVGMGSRFLDVAEGHARVETGRR